MNLRRHDVSTGMTNVEVDISMSIDGFVTGPNIDEHPGLGEGGRILHDWLGTTTARAAGSSMWRSPPPDPSSRAARSST
jgi:hypothetical protein